MQQDLATTRPVTVDGNVIDSTVAARDAKAGETVLRIPEHLVVTLNRCGGQRHSLPCLHTSEPHMRGGAPFKQSTAE